MNLGDGAPERAQSALASDSLPTAFCETACHSQGAPLTHCSLEVGLIRLRLLACGVSIHPKHWRRCRGSPGLSGLLELVNNLAASELAQSTFSLTTEEV